MHHEATVTWTSGEADAAAVTAGRYSRVHRIGFDGGAALRGSPAPAFVPAPWSDPEGADPEEMFVASAAACHMLWFLDLARRAGHAAASYEDRAVGVMETNEAGELWISRIALRPRILWQGEAPASDEVARLHEAAHRRCFIANSMKTEITVAQEVQA